MKSRLQRSKDAIKCSPEAGSAQVYGVLDILLAVGLDKGPGTDRFNCGAHVHADKKHLVTHLVFDCVKGLALKVDHLLVQAAGTAIKS